jgi:low temperature requirement protein LtrA
MPYPIRDPMTSSEQSPAHGLRPMSGRDPYKQHRVATPLELMYDLTFVVGFGVAGEQFAHLLAEGDFAAHLIGFGFAIFAVCWCWINFSWFASAYDTDDWAFRVATMVQMVGVIVLALGLPGVFHSIDEGHTIDNSVAVAG